MHGKVYVFLLLQLLLCGNICAGNTKSAVTFELNGGRFGDNIFSSSQAFFIHWRYGLPFLFQPFTYSNQLKIFYLYPHCSEKIAQQFKQKLRISKGKAPVIDNFNAILYTTIFYPPIDIDWSDNEFVCAFRDIIAPADPAWRPMELPQDRHAIAIHIRTGGDFKPDEQSRIERPLQFPPFDYYVQTLQLLLHHLQGPCHVHIFTDHSKPKSLAKKIKKKLSSKDRARVTITYRVQGNAHNAHVVADFFNMMQFKYVIRTQSRFSSFVEQLGTCFISIYPITISQKKHKVKVSHINVSVFTQEECRMQTIALTGTHKRTNDIPLLHKPAIRNILVSPMQRPAHRPLNSELPSCY